MDSITYQSLVTKLLSDFNDYFQTSVRHSLHNWTMLQTMLGYHLGWNSIDGTPQQSNPGKQIRPLLALLSCGASGGDPQSAWPMAAAIEMLHNFSLIHDDVMDISEKRRGREAVWKIWGTNQAINVGDGAYGLSFQLLADAENAEPQTIVYAQRILSKACVDTVYGQMLDISFEDRDDVTSAEYIQMVGLKTGPLLGAALAGGALFAQRPYEEALALAEIGREVGVIFQMQDDILGIWGQTAKTGKSANDDLTAKKKSYPIIWALENLAPQYQQMIKDWYSLPAPLPIHITKQMRQLLTEQNVEQSII
ncbi:MAG: hypothetical protein CUN55_15990, partial [Phototrophicales bacterium]